jgi:uncharacterized protein
MNQLFLQLVQSVTGNVITIVALELAAAIIGFAIAWFYARSVYTPVIKGLESEKTNLNNQVVKLKAEVHNLDKKVNEINEKIVKLEEEKVRKDKEIKDLSAKIIPVGKYVISKSKSGENYFNLKATNGQVILTSIMFSSIDECMNRIESVRNICEDDNRYDRKISTNNKHYFNFTSPEGQIIGKSEMYEGSGGMENGIASIKKNGKSTTMVED